MKCIVVGGYAPSLINFRAALLKALVSAGLEVMATAAEPDPTVSETLAKWGIVYRPVPMARSGLNPLSDLRYRQQLRGLLHAEAPDLVLAYTHKPVIYSALAAATLSAPPRVYPLITGLGFAFMGGGGWKARVARSALLALYRRASRHFSGVFFQNPDDEALFHKLGLVPPTVPNAIVRGSGIDLERFPFVRSPSNHSCEAATSQGSTRFLLIARLLADKGIRELVQAARLVKREVPKAEFHLVGPLDPNPAAIRLDEVKVWVGEGLIHYHGAQADVRPFVRECDVYVLPSYREGTPRTVLEAMATGRAVITTDAPGCRETIFDAGPPDSTGVREGRNGFLVPVKSVSPLVHAMLVLARDPAKRQAMGEAGRRLAEEHYDVHKVNASMLEFMGVGKK